MSVRGGGMVLASAYVVVLPDGTQVEAPAGTRLIPRGQVDRVGVIAGAVASSEAHSEAVRVEASPGLNADGSLCVTCGTVPSKSDRIVAALRDRPRMPIGELTTLIYGADPVRQTRRGRENTVRALLVQLQEYGRVRRVGYGAWEAVSVEDRA